MRRDVAALLFVPVALICAGAVACGGGTNASKDHEGAAASATAQFFVQEAAGAKLPEGASVVSIGAKGIVPLGVTEDQKKQSVKLRYCVEYAYRGDVTPFTTHNRVYITSMLKDGWSVESVKNDGTCEGVS